MDFLRLGSMAQKEEVDVHEITVKCGTKGSMRRCSTSGTITKGSSDASIRSEKPIPHYLRVSAGSCHDICKYGRKHDSVPESKSPQKPSPHYRRASTGSCHDISKYGRKHESETVSKQRLSFSKSGGKLKLIDESLVANNLNMENCKKRATIKQKYSFQKDELPEKMADSNLKAGSKLGTSDKYMDIKLQSVSSCQKSSVSSDQEVLQTSEIKEAGTKIKDDGTPEKYVDIKFWSVSSCKKNFLSSDREVLGTSECKDTKVQVIDLKDETKKQVMKLKTPSKLNSLVYKSKIDEQKHAPSAEGNDAVQKLGAITNKTPTFLEPTASSKAKLVAAHDNPTDLNHNSSVSHVNEKYVASKEAGISKEKERIDKATRESTKTPAKHILRSSTASPSLKRVGDDILSLRQRKDQIVKEATLTNNREVSKVGHDAEVNGEKTLQVIDNSFEKVDLDSSEQRVLQVENVLSKLQKQTLVKHESSEEKTFQVIGEIHEKVNLDSSDLPAHLPVEKLLALEYSNWDANQELLEVNNFNIDLTEKKALGGGAVELNSDDLKFTEPENDDIKFPEQNLLKLVEIDFASKDMETTQSKLLAAENGLPMQKSLKLDDKALVSPVLQHHEHKFYKQVNLETVDISPPELKSDDYQLSQLATDYEEVEGSEYSYSDSSEKESEHELEENKDNCESSKGIERRSKRNSAIHPDDTNPTAYKLKFRRGKTIEVQPEYSGPRRLKFRRRTVDGNVEGIQTERRNFRKSEISEPANASSAETQGIMLKHQSLQDKKDERVLFNNVIEETASKLVETRKSKVKALVGAFETVISLPR
ncbi:uncharacterized protein LOC121971666 isoform X1 [Zingiber officinale]|uniref:Calmodulin-binding domain-containing protein n=2 Tax=Zingiber officinale TaxID=94328 RepID=A0A8J5H5G5_ZINOF|nr:uncharacterized protein LOC121971666 isoform X1 [Zingiber officinale]KAG6516236.1 hypothetical protein ZIOFF_026689 [Zingiber officinale]